MQRVAIDSSIQIPNDEDTDASLFQGTVLQSSNKVSLPIKKYKFKNIALL
jgi:hypothetical protein